MAELKIYIPTFMREENQKCFNNMPPEIQKLTTLVTHSGRAEELRKHNPSARILDLGQTDGIADVRQKLLDAAESDFVMIIDDSCTFKVRNEKLELSDLELSDWYAMFRMVRENLDIYPMVGISDRGGNNRVPEDIKEVARSYSCYGVNRKAWKEAGVSFDGMYQKDKSVKLYEDFYAILSLLTRGLKNAVIFKYAFNHPHGKAGGNSTIRTNALQKHCLEALQREFPLFVTLTKKEDPSWKAGLADEENFRWECQIAWKEAYESSQVGNTLEDFFG